MSFYALMGAISQGLVYSLMALGVYLTFRVLDFPDLTVDGSFPLGAAVSAVLITHGVSPFLALPVAVAAGMTAGLITGFLSTKLNILNLLASILTMIALYSINLRIMGRPNISLINRKTVFDLFGGLRELIGGMGIPGFVMVPFLFLGVIVVVKICLDLFLHTQLGLALRATGDNPHMIRAQGVNTDFTIMLGVAISNGLVALSGALFSQNQGSADVNMGVGTIVAGLASVIVGEAIIGEMTVFRATMGVVIGSVIYRLAIAIALTIKIGSLQITPSDLKLITAILVVIALTFPTIRSKIKLDIFRKGNNRQ